MGTGNQAVTIQIKRSPGFGMTAQDARLRIRMLVLHALFHDAQGEKDAALERLTEAVALAQSSDDIRSFLDLRPRVTKMLRHLAIQNVHEDFVRRILEASDEGEPKERPCDHSSSCDKSVLDLLTYREQEILILLVQRLSDREIAQTLLISTETVKTHLKSIYRKLGVHGRREAAVRATALGILQAGES
jgi:LuxR family maltose regulon positive regulatory protein